MRQLIFLIMLLTGYCLGSETQEQKEFHYEEIVVIAAIKDDKNCIFGGPTLLKMRSIAAEAASRFEPILNLPTSYIYELFMVDKNGTSAKAFLGDHWLSDGTQISQLSDTDFSFLKRVIDARKFENENSTLEALTRDINVATFKNELLKTEDYENIGGVPKDDKANPKLERSAPNSSSTPTNDENKNMEGLKKSANNK